MMLFLVHYHRADHCSVGIPKIQGNVGIAFHQGLLQSLVESTRSLDVDIFLFPIFTDMWLRDLRESEATGWREREQHRTNQYTVAISR